MVFTANAGLARDGVVAISSFYHPERQGEEPHFRKWFHEAGYTVVDLPRDTRLRARAMRCSRWMDRGFGRGMERERWKQAMVPCAGFGMSR